MQNKINKFQMGDLVHHGWQEQKVIKNLPDHNLKILDIGSGIAFNFEKTLSEIRGGAGQG